ncbi:MAG: hypothetical protein STSR0009_19620 [Methanoregula sp.]
MNRAFMIALVLVVFLSFVGVVSADDYWKGAAPTTINGISGAVDGGINVTFVDTWKTTNPVEYDDAWANITLVDTISASKPLQFARLYVVMYTANMTDNWRGNFSVTLYRGSGSSSADVVTHQPLDLNYVNTSGIVYNSSLPVSGIYLKNLSRVTSDYMAIMNVKNLLNGWAYGGDYSDLRVHVETWNESKRLQDGYSRFDGRIKEVKLVYGWNVTSGSTGTTKYWVNEGMDPMTKNIGTYIENKTWFNGTGSPAPQSYTANLWVDYLSSANGNGTYTWNGNSISYNSAYPPTTTQGVYAGLNQWTWSSGLPGLSSDGNNVLTYSRTNSWYKNIVSVLTIGPEEV